MSKTCDYGTMFIYNPYFHLNYLEYLLQLFKVSLQLLMFYIILFISIRKFFIEKREFGRTNIH